jgi:ribosomal RNA assembly protein
MRRLLVVARSNTFVKIPKDRIGALIGPDGREKENIEQKLNVELTIDSETGDVTITLNSDAQDPSLLFRAKEVVTAIGRGFSPDRSFRLIRAEDAMLEVIDLREMFGRSLSELQRVKGRIIGQEGKTRRIIEELTEADVSVHGHTISIIADFDQMNVTKEAIRMLLQGSQHSKVYRFLQRKRSEMKKKKLELWEKPYEELKK